MSKYSQKSKEKFKNLFSLANIFMSGDRNGKLKNSFSYFRGFRKREERKTQTSKHKKRSFMMSDKNSSEKQKNFEGKEEIMRKSGLQTVIYLL